MSAAGTEFVRGAGLRVRLRRTGEGPPLVLINGLGTPLEMWSPLAREQVDTS